MKHLMPGCLTWRFLWLPLGIRMLGRHIAMLSISYQCSFECDTSMLMFRVNVHGNVHSASQVVT